MRKKPHFFCRWSFDHTQNKKISEVKFGHQLNFVVGDPMKIVLCQAGFRREILAILRRGHFVFQTKLELPNRPQKSG